MDLGLRAGAVDLRDAVVAAEDQVALDDRELVAVERAHGRTGRAVALGVVGAAVAGAAEAGDGEHRDGRHDLTPGRLHRLGLGLLHEAERLHGQPRCAQRFEMIVKLGHPVERAVVADVRRPVPDRLPVRDEPELRDPPLVERELRDRAEVTGFFDCFRKGGTNARKSGGTVTNTPISAAEAERHSAEEA